MSEVATHDPAVQTQVCVVCGDPLVNRHEGARYCSPACRTEASRLKAILNGNYAGPYRSIKERLEAAQKGVQRALRQRQDSAQGHRNPCLPREAHTENANGSASR